VSVPFKYLRAPSVAPAASRAVSRLISQAVSASRTERPAIGHSDSRSNRLRSASEKTMSGAIMAAASAIADAGLNNACTCRSRQPRSLTSLDSTSVYWA